MPLAKVVELHLYQPIKVVILNLHRVPTFQLLLQFVPEKMNGCYVTRETCKWKLSNLGLLGLVHVEPTLQIF